MKSARFVCTCFAALCAVAGSAMAGPGKTWQGGPQLERARPIRMAKFTKVNGQVQLTTAWQQVSAQSGSLDGAVEPAFDCYEGDPNSLPGLNVPTGFTTCGNNSTVPGAEPGSRWYAGPTWVQPRTFNDMTLGAGFSGADSTRVSWAYFQPVTPTSVFIAVSTYEDFGTACVFPATPGFIDGIIFEFLPVVVAGGFYVDEDLTVGPTPLSFGLPMDGSGAYEIEFYSDETATTLITTPGIQPFYWGTGEDEPVPDGRVGTQDINEFDDDTAPFGGAYGTAECYNLTAAPNQCPLVLGAMMEFWAEGTACYPDCNLTGTLTIADFGCFQASFAGGQPYADCNQSGTLTIADFGCFQAAFAAGCP